MSDKSLKDKAIKIKGKDYVLVSDRVKYFNENYPNGAIQTELISDWNSDYIVIKAKITPDVTTPERYFTDYSQATVGDGMVNKTAALENASTSAVGRCLGYMGIGVLESIASADEMHKAATQSERVKYATPAQIKWIRDTAAREYNLDNEEEINTTIESVLTIPVDKVPIYKVKDAVDTLVKDARLQKEELLNKVAPVEVGNIY